MLNVEDHRSAESHRSWNAGDDGKRKWCKERKKTKRLEKEKLCKLIDLKKESHIMRREN